MACSNTSNTKSTPTKQQHEPQQQSQQQKGESDEKESTGKRKRPSRRVAQRILNRKKRLLQSTLEQHQSNIDKQLKRGIVASLERSSTLQAKATFLTKLKCKHNFGFASDPALPVWKNVENVLAHMQVKDYFNRPNNMTYHNLCTKSHPPKGIGSTLGLGLKFCIQSDRAPDFVDKSVNRFSDDVRKKYIFAGSVPKETPKKIYIKSTWTPDPAPEHVEDRMDAFARALSAEHNFLTKNLGKYSNLTNLQKSQINLLRSNRDFVILISDKNLGPAIMERDLYIKNILREHLLDGKTYSQISENEGNETLEFVETETRKLLREYKKYISEEELCYFNRGLAKNKRIPQFYGLPKVHKNKIPMPFRPVVSQCGSVFSVISTFIDYILQTFTKSIHRRMLQGITELK